MATNLTLYTTLNAETKWIGNRWCAIAKKLPLHAYGDTAQEASTRLTLALEALVKTLIIAGGTDEVDAFLKRLESITRSATVLLKPRNPWKLSYRLFGR